MHYRQQKDIGSKHYLSYFIDSGGWKRCTLFHIERNESGTGATAWPIAQIDLVNHPAGDGTNPHTEVTISLRNDIRRAPSGIVVDENRTKLRHAEDIVDHAVLDHALAALQELGHVCLPCSVCICIRHIEDYRIEGEFWSDD